MILNEQARLRYKSDWAEAKERLGAWWRGEAMDRPCVAITAPRDGADRTPLPAADLSDLERYWLDFPACLARSVAQMERTAHLGEAYPNIVASLGPGSLGVFLGAGCRYHERTIWYEPCFRSLHEAAIRWDPQNRFWRWTVEHTRSAVEQGAGTWIVEMPDLIENLDTLAALVGTERLLVGLIEAPGEVHRLQRLLVPAYFQAFEALYDLVSPAEGGAGWIAFHAWAPGRMAKLQCDLSAMISPAMYEEFVLPYLVEQCRRLEFTLYHLDGPDAVKHLKSVLSLERLGVLQWTPGAGAADGGDPVWDPIYRAALDAGKGIHASMEIGAVRAFVKRLGRRGVYIATSASNEAEARQLLRDLERP